MRLVLITRRYWPLVGGAEKVMARLAREFTRRGHTVTVLTAAWSSDWPLYLVHRGVPVVRLRQSPWRWRGTWEYMRGVGRWLREHRKEYDAVLVSMLKHSAYVAVGEGRRWGIPVVLRAEGGGETGDCRFHETARFGMRLRRRCQDAAAIVAPADSVADELLMAGFAREKIISIANGVPIPERLPMREAARQALAGIHDDLRLEKNAPLVVYTGRLDRAKGLGELLRAWPRVVARHPHAALWLVGEGPFRDELFQQIQDAELLESVRLPGTFDNVTEILAAADLFVLPSYAEGLSLSLLEAMAHGVPVVASDVPGNRQVISSPEEGLLVPPRDVDTLAHAMLEVLDAERAESLGHAGRRRVAAAFSLDRMADEHLALLERVAAG